MTPRPSPFTGGLHRSHLREQTHRLLCWTTPVMVPVSALVGTALDSMRAAFLTLAVPAALVSVGLSATWVRSWSPTWSRADLAALALMASTALVGTMVALLSGAAPAALGLCSFAVVGTPVYLGWTIVRDVVALVRRDAQLRADLARDVSDRR